MEALEFSRFWKSEAVASRKSSYFKTQQRKKNNFDFGKNLFRKRKLNFWREKGLDEKIGGTKVTWFEFLWKNKAAFAFVNIKAKYLTDSGEH